MLAIKKFCACLTMCLVVMLYSLPAFAAVETLTADADYILQETESAKEGQEIAFKEAMRRISQQAGVYIESKSRSENNTLTADEMTMITNTIVKVKERKPTKHVEPNGRIRVAVRIVAEYDTDLADKMLNDMIAARKATQGYEKIQAEYMQKGSELDRLKRQYAGQADKEARHYIRAGQKKERAGDLAGAMADYEKAVSIAPNYARTYSRRGHIYRKQGRSDLAKQDYDKAYSLDPKEPGLHLGRGIFLEQAGKNLEAVEEYRTFIKQADIMEYDEEITWALDRMVELFDGV